MNTFEKCFSGKRAVVTGGSSGIGLATCELLGELGCTVYNLDVQAPTTKSAGTDYLNVNIASHTAVGAAATQLKSTGPIHFLFANAGIHTIGDIVDSNWEEVEQTLNVNLKGTFLTLRAFLPLMEVPGSSVVINASDQAMVGKATSAAYGATKAAIGQLAKGQGLRFIEKGIRINAICPGGVDTKMESDWAPKYAAKYGGTAAEWTKRSIEGNPLKRLIAPREVAQVVAFLFSDWSSAVNGALWTVDGGFTAG